MNYRILGPKGKLIVRSATLARVKAISAALRRRFGAIRILALRPSERDLVVQWAKWGVKNEPRIHYTETPARSDWLAATPHQKLPLSTDCSGFATLCYKLAGAADPNGFGYKTLGYTGTLLDCARTLGKETTKAKARPGDLIVYGPGTGEHVAIIVKAGVDPLTVSHGSEDGPKYERVSQDGRQPQRILSFLP